MLAGDERIVRIGHADAALVVEVLAFADAGQDVVRLGLVGSEVVDVLGGDERDAGLLRELDEVAVARLLFVELGVVLDLEEEVSRSEDVDVLAGDLLGLAELVHGQRLADGPAHAAREPDEPLGVLAKDLSIYTGLVVEALEVRDGGQLEEVAVALFGLAKKDDLVRLVVDAGSFVGQFIERHESALPDDRLDLLLAALLVELDGAVDRRVIRQRDGVHIHLFGSLRQLIQLGQSLEEAVVAMNMEVDEFGGHEDWFWFECTRFYTIQKAMQFEPKSNKKGTAYRYLVPVGQVRRTSLLPGVRGICVADPREARRCLHTKDLDRRAREAGRTHTRGSWSAANPLASW